MCSCRGYSTVCKEVTTFSHIFSTLGVILQILIPKLCDQDMNRHFLHKHSGKKLCGEKKQPLSRGNEAKKYPFSQKSIWKKHDTFSINKTQVFQWHLAE